MQIKPSTGSASIPKYKMSLNIKLSYAARISLRAGSEEKKNLKTFLQFQRTLFVTYCYFLD